MKSTALCLHFLFWRGVVWVFRTDKLAQSKIGYAQAALGVVRNEQNVLGFCYQTETHRRDIDNDKALKTRVFGLKRNETLHTQIAMNNAACVHMTNGPDERGDHLRRCQF